MKSLIIISLLLALKAAPQNNIAHVTVWRPNGNNIADFENGYKQHLAWHKLNKDSWDWYGWYVISGTRYGCFIDASFDHSWADFDHAVSPQEDRADNLKNVVPYGKLQTTFKAVAIPSASTEKKIPNSNFLRLIQIQSERGDIEWVLSELKRRIEKKSSISFYTTYRITDGDDLGKYMVLIGCSSWKEFAKTDNIYGLLGQIQKERKLNVVKTVTAEMLRYRGDMSLVH